MHVELFYTFPLSQESVQSLEIACSAVERGFNNTLGFAIAQNPFEENEKTQCTFFEITVPTHTISSVSMPLPYAHIVRLHLLPSQTQKQWALAVSADNLGGHSPLDIYDISAEKSIPWSKIFAIEDLFDQYQLDKMLIAFWQHGDSHPLLCHVPDISEMIGSQLYYLSWQAFPLPPSFPPSFDEGYRWSLYLGEQAWMLFTCQAAIEKHVPSGREKRGTWSCSYGLYTHQGTCLQKVSLPKVRMKVQNTHTPLDDLFNWLLVSIRSGAGPLDPITQEQTCIAAICLQDDPDFLHRLYSPTAKENGERQSTQGGLYCITMQGHMLASDTSLLGLYTSFCTWGEHVIGVTLVQGTWQLWKWMPLQKTAHALVETLSPDILRVTVLLPTNQREGSDPWFWCVEEYASGIRILQRVCDTFREVQSTWCDGSHFLNVGNAALIYDWPAQGITTYEQTLFLLVRDKSEQLQLLKFE